MKYLNNLLSEHKVLFNVQKTKKVIFKYPKKVLSDEIKIKLSGKLSIHQTQENILV